MLSSVPWSCLPCRDGQPRHNLHHCKLLGSLPALPSPNQRAHGSGAGGVFGVGGFFPPLMLLKTKGWNTLLPLSIKTGLKYRFVHGFNSSFPCTSQLYSFSNASQLRFLLLQCSGCEQQGHETKEESKPPLQSNRSKSCHGRFSLPEASNSFLVPAIAWRVQHKTRGRTWLLCPAVSCIPLPSELQMKCSHPAVGFKCCRKKHALGEHGSVGRVVSESLCNVCCKGGQQEREPRKCCLWMDITPRHRENHHDSTGQKQLPPAPLGKEAANTTPPPFSVL